MESSLFLDYTYSAAIEATGHKTIQKDGTIFENIERIFYALVNLVKNIINKLRGIKKISLPIEFTNDVKGVHSMFMTYLSDCCMKIKSMYEDNIEDKIDKIYQTKQWARINNGKSSYENQPVKEVNTFEFISMMNKTERSLMIAKQTLASIKRTATNNEDEEKMKPIIRNNYNLVAKICKCDIDLLNRIFRYDKKKKGPVVTPLENTIKGSSEKPAPSLDSYIDFSSYLII